MTFVIKIVQMLLILGRRNPVDRLETFREVSGRGETGSVYTSSSPRSKRVIIFASCPAQIATLGAINPFP